jgi:NAD kinase
MGFNLGSLGFLTPFRISNYKKSISGILQECYLTLRSRLFCVVVREVEGVETITSTSISPLAIGLGVQFQPNSSVHLIS